MSNHEEDEYFIVCGEPAPGYVVRGPYADGTFRAFARSEDGSQHLIGSADDYESARNLCFIS